MKTHSRLSTAFYEILFGSRHGGITKPVFVPMTLRQKETPTRAGSPLAVSFSLFMCLRWMRRVAVTGSD